MKTKQVKISAQKRANLTSKKDKLWFPFSQEELDKRVLVETGTIFSRLGVLPEGTSLWASVRKKELSKFGLTVNDRYLFDDPRPELILVLKSSIEANFIPTHSLPIRDPTVLDVFLTNKPVDLDYLNYITFIIALKIKHSNELKRMGVISTKSSLDALDFGMGDCLQRASILTAVLRLNNIPARIVGHETFFESRSDVTKEEMSHYWVEAYLNSEWISLDTAIPRRILGEIMEAFQKGISIEELIPTVISSCNEQKIPYNEISKQEFSQKLIETIVCAEIDFPE